MLIGFGGYAGVGKDSLFQLFAKYGSITKYGARAQYKRYAFADGLKMDLRDQIQKENNFDILNCSKEQKDSVRSLLVETARKKKDIDPCYWVKRTLVSVEIDIQTPSILPCITDLRFPEEMEYLYNSFNGPCNFIAISRFGVGPANKEEEIYTSKIYESPNVIQFGWDDIEKYSERDLAEIVKYLESQMYVG